MKTILTFGDSNTYGTLPMARLGQEGRYDMATRWPCVMRQALGDAYHLVEEGHPGRTTVHDDPIEGAHRNGARILQSVIESHRPIDILTIMLGTNDHKYRFSLGAIDIAHGVGRLIDIAKLTGYVRNILVICPPRVLERGCLAEIFAGAEAKTAGLSDHMKAVAKNRNVYFYDAGELIASDPLDGVHLSAESHHSLGCQIAEFIRENIQ